MTPTQAKTECATSVASPGTRVSHRSNWIFLLAVAVICLPSAWFAWQYRGMPQLGAFHDDAVYWTNGKALAQEHTYVIPGLPERPFQTKYPPLYPALLALMWSAGGSFPGNLPLAALVQWAFIPLFAALVGLTFRRLNFPEPAVWGLTVLASLQPMTIVFGTSLMTELPFTVMLLAILLLLDRDREGTHSTGFYLGAGVLAAFSILVRTNGIGLLVAVPFVLALRKQFLKAAYFAAPLLVTFIGWQLWCRAHASKATDDVLVYYVSYVGMWIRCFSAADFPSRLWVNAGAVCEGLARLVLFQSSESTLVRILEWVITAAAVSGIVRLVKTSASTLVRYYAAFAIPFICLLILWNYPPDPRFLYPLLPLYLAGLYSKFSEIAQEIARTWRLAKGSARIGPAIAASVIAAFPIASAATLAYGVTVTLPDYFNDRVDEQANTLPVYRWVEQNTPTDARFAAYDDVMLYLYTGRQGYTTPILSKYVYEGDAAGIAQYIRTLPAFWSEKAVRYVLVTSYDYRRDLHSPAQNALRELLQDRSRYALRYSVPTAQVYEILSAR